MDRILQRAPALVILVGVAGTLALALPVPEGAFYSGDGGLKYLMARQVASGGLHADLRIPADGWVAALWDRGLYPFGPPFVYAMDGARYLSFPLLFPFAAAPLLAAFGWTGLFVLPLLAVWGAWIAAWALLRRAGAGPGLVAVALAALVLATPLTLYAAMFWEHAPAAALALAGVPAFGPRVGAPRSAAAAFASGVASGVALGVAGWLRPECLVVAAIAAPAGLAVAARTREWRSPVAACAGLAAVAAGLVATNLAIHGLPLGPHALQVVGPEAMWRPGWPRLATNLALLLAAFAPLSIAGVAALGLLRSSHPAGRLAAFLAAVAVAACLAIPAVVPNSGGTQWGPRYLLAPIVLLTVAAALAVHAVRAGPSPPLLRRLCPPVAAGLALLGTIGNAGVGVPDLADHYADRVRFLDALRADPHRVIAASYHYVPLELASLFDDKAVFTVLDEAGFRALAAGLHERGIDGYLFLSYAEGGSAGAAGTGETRRTSDLDDLVVDCTRGPPIGPEWVSWDCRIASAGQR
ncbi:MAG: hypothetical protein FJ087_16485 [Deltaproteobacteria bacterium]|nr:hypothetical protein [Deltaproteobacteria bacterium]